MTRSKKNYDHLVDYYGNYTPFEFKRLTNLYIGSVKAAFPGNGVGFWSDDETGPPTGEIWGYNFSLPPYDYPNKGITNWYRIKINENNVFYPDDYDPVNTTSETENRLFEMYLPDGRLILNATVDSIKVTNGWFKIQLFQKYFQASEGPGWDPLQVGSPLDVKVFIR